MSVTVAQLRAENRIILEYVSGSRLYGINRPDSDTDIRGLYLPTLADNGLTAQPLEEAADDNQNVKFYSLRKFFSMASSGNPSVMEMFFLPKDSIIISSPIYERIRELAGYFVTKRLFYAYSGYATDQLKKATGKNKKAMFLEKFVSEDELKQIEGWLKDGLVTTDWMDQRFCHSFTEYMVKRLAGKVLASPIDIDWKRMDALYASGTFTLTNRPERRNFVYIVAKDRVTEMPFRPAKLELELVDKLDVSSVEHMPSMLRFYKNGSGMFHDNKLAYTSISKERELSDFYGVGYFNEEAYGKESAEYKSFWEWMAKRNEDRYKNDWNADKSFDRKNLGHLVRLVYEAENILNMGRPMIKLEGAQKQMVMDIRNSGSEGYRNVPYEEVVEMVNAKVPELAERYRKSTLPEQPDWNKVEKLYLEMIG